MQIVPKLGMLTIEEIEAELMNNFNFTKSYVINHCGNGWNYGRLTADGLRGVCTYTRMVKWKKMNKKMAGSI